MRRLLEKALPKSPPRTPPPPTVGPVSQALTTIDPRVKGLGMLIATASGIASSIASPPRDPADIAPDEPGPSKESHWRTAYNAAKIALDTANASSDMFLPLKAVVGALSVFIKNYDQTADNAGQIGEIEGRVHSLQKVLESPVGDQDNKEKARRDALRKELVSIIGKLKPLSERHWSVKYLNNVDLAKTLNGLVRELDTAVIDYQTSLQQNTYENTNKINEGVQNISNKFDEGIQNITNKLNEGIQNVNGTTDLELLGKVLNPVHNAGYQAAHHDTCLFGTRESVLDGMIRWAENPQDKKVYWLNGLAGTGKSTIAQTFCEMVAEAGILGASFFCSRDNLNRKELKHIFPTIAYQLACRHPVFRKRIIHIITKDPSVAEYSLISQLKDLIVVPLSSTNISCVIVVDALDECVDNQPASALLSVLGRHVKDLQSVKFFITGRPEPLIRRGFRLPLLEPITQIFLLHKVEISNVNEDIQLYLQEKLTEIAKQRSDFDVSNPWPGDQDLLALTKKSSGLFIFASTLIRFIGSEYHEPHKRLQLIVTQSDGTVHEGGAGIDSLYTQVLEHAFLGVNDPMVFTNLKRVLGTVVLAFNPLSLEQVAKILGSSTHLITTTLQHLHSVLLLPSEDSKEIRVFHKSFPDFLQDHNRCSDPKFHIDTPTCHGDIALGCLESLKELKPNPCGLPDFVMNQDVPNLSELLEEKVGSAMRYACSYWAMHVQSSPTTGDHTLLLITSTTKFFRANGIQWIEVMSLENQLESVIHGIHSLFNWFDKVGASASNLRHLAEDYLRFTMNFFHLIQQSAPHIYYSALPLSPTSSTFHSMIPREKTLITGGYGCPESWGIIIQTIRSGPTIPTCMTTFGHWIAVAYHNGIVKTYHTATGALRLSLGPMDAVRALGGSPDGSTLFCAHQENSVTLWDIQTGGLIHSSPLTEGVQRITISLKGHYLACRVSGGYIKVWEVANGVGDTTIWDFPSNAPFCWLEPEERLMIADGLSVHMWDVVAGRTVLSFTVVDEQEGSGSKHKQKRIRTGERISGMIYSQIHDRLAIVTQSEPLKGTVTIIHPQAATISASLGFRNGLTCFAFSRTTKELVCGMQANGLRILNFSQEQLSRRYLELSHTVKCVSSLPNGAIAVDSGNSGIQLLSLDSSYALASQSTSALAISTFDQDRIIALHLPTHNSIQFLETSTVSNFFGISAPDDSTNSLTAVLCASLENHMVVYYLQEGGNVRLRLCRVGGRGQGWTVGANRRPLACGISPTGIWLVTLHDIGYATCICMWDTANGQLQARITVDSFNSSSPHITFDSETRFYSHHRNHRIPYDLDFLSGAHPPHTIIPHEKQPWTSTVEPIKRQYEVDKSHEWVVRGSERICWIPPGYIGSTEGDHYWVGPNVLVMNGEDGVLRMFSFRL